MATPSRKSTRSTLEQLRALRLARAGTATPGSTTPLGPKRTVVAVGTQPVTGQVPRPDGKPTASNGDIKPLSANEIDESIAEEVAEVKEVNTPPRQKTAVESASPTSIPAVSPPTSLPLLPRSRLDSDSEEEWVPTSKRQAPPSARRRMVQSSDEESPVRPAFTQLRITRPVIDLTEETDTGSDSGIEAASSDVDSLVDAGRPHRPIILGSSDDDQSEGDQQDQPDSEDEASDDVVLARRIQKYYDTSAGSLDDFIVHDSDEFTDAELVERPKPRVWSEAEESDGFNDGSEDSLYDSEADEPGPSRRRKKVPIVRRGSSEDVDLPDLEGLTLSSPSGSPESKKKSTVRKADMTNKAWELARQQIAEAHFKELDEMVFGGRLGPGGCGTTVVWTKTLRKTGGVARRKRDPAAQASDPTTQYVYKIELSEKVLTDEHRVRSTLAHEMCHVATWFIDNDNTAHGRAFKSWGRKVTRAMPDIKVTTCHSYKIEFKYEYRCSNAQCHAGVPPTWGRHSKSIDVQTATCPVCHSKIIELFESRTSSETPWRAYLRLNMPLAKAALGEASFAQLMQALGARWAVVRPETDDAAHWQGLGNNAEFL